MFQYLLLYLRCGLPARLAIAPAASSTLSVFAPKCLSVLLKAIGDPSQPDQ